VKYLLVIALLFFYNYKAFAENFLIANPQMQDSRFKESVILLLYHNEFGASGLVINKPEKTMNILELFSAANMPIPDNIINKDLRIFWGGPINNHHLFFIHSSEYKSKNPIIINNRFSITRSSDILYDIANDKGPDKFIIVKGFSVWSPGQLNEELNRNSWEEMKDIYLNIFDNNKNIWQILINSQGV